jgi:hypothetical protein
MKKILFFTGLCLTQLSFAAGSMNCIGKLNNGGMIELSTMVPFHSMHLVSPLSLSLNGKVIETIDQDQVDGRWIEKRRILINALDKNEEENILRLEYYGKNNAQNKLVFKNQLRKKTTLKNIICEIE